MAGVSFSEVPYKSATHVMPDLMSGRVMLTFNALTGTKALISTGKLRGLAVTSAQRSSLFPELPTVAETVPGYESDGWYGVAVPTGVPAAITKRLADEIVAVLNLPEPREKLLEQGLQIVGATREQFARIIRADTEKYGKLMRDFDIKPQD
jgi:tripartite-type tricarboxylate transporter receptor subunit TctC